MYNKVKKLSNKTKERILKTVLYTAFALFVSLFVIIIGLGIINCFWELEDTIIDFVADIVHYILYIFLATMALFLLLIFTIDYEYKLKKYHL